MELVVDVSACINFERNNRNLLILAKVIFDIQLTTVTTCSPNVASKTRYDV